MRRRSFLQAVCGAAMAVIAPILVPGRPWEWGEEPIGKGFVALSRYGATCVGEHVFRPRWGTYGIGWYGKELGA